MTRQVRILRAAERDLEEIYRYLSRDRPRTAQTTVERILDGVESLSEHADRGSKPKDDRLRALGYRYLVHTPYLIFYKILPRQVRVYRVLHGRRKYEPCL